MRCWPLPFFLLTRASRLAFLTGLVANVGGPTPVPLRSGNQFSPTLQRLSASCPLTCGRTGME